MRRHLEGTQPQLDGKVSLLSGAMANVNNWPGSLLMWSISCFVFFFPPNFKVLKILC